VQETILFHSPRDRCLIATVHQPSRAPRGAMIVAHGMLSSRHSPKHVAMCAAAAADGWLALRFDFAGRGDSQGTMADLTVSGEILDLTAAVAEMRARTDAPLVVVGSSLGGAVAILAAPVIHPAGRGTGAAPAVLDRSSREPGRPTPPPANDLPESFITDARRHDPEEAARCVTCPWLIIHGARDDVVPVDHARVFADACPEARLAIHADADHRFWSTIHREWLVSRAIEFASGVVA
jgi:alpha-beta hydrolase superfamily lysophospholipase